MSKPAIPTPPNKTPTVLERVGRIEQALNQLGESTGVLRQTIGEAIEVVQAIIAELGSEFEGKIEARIQAKRDEVRRERDKRAADAVAQMVESGVLTATDVIGEDSLVVGREFNALGEITSERVQAVFSMFSQPVKDAILGQGVGALYENDQGKFEVLEVYQFTNKEPLSETPPAPVATPDVAPAVNPPEAQS